MCNYTCVEFIFLLIVRRNEHENLNIKSIDRKIGGQRDHDEGAANSGVLEWILNYFFIK